MIPPACEGNHIRELNDVNPLVFNDRCACLILTLASFAQPVHVFEDLLLVQVQEFGIPGVIPFVQEGGKNKDQFIVRMDLNVRC